MLKREGGGRPFRVKDLVCPVSFNLSLGTMKLLLADVLEVFRQGRQWQTARASGSPSKVYLTWPQRQDPECVYMIQKVGGFL